MANVDNARRWYAAMRAKEQDVALSLMHPDLVLIEAASLPYAGDINADGLREIRGRAGFFEWSERSGPRRFEGFDFESTNFFRWASAERRLWRCSP
jgi:hypothetical protein